MGTVESIRIDKESATIPMEIEGKFTQAILDARKKKVGKEFFSSGPIMYDLRLPIVT